MIPNPPNENPTESIKGLIPAHNPNQQTNNFFAQVLLLASDRTLIFFISDDYPLKHNFRPGKRKMATRVKLDFDEFMPAFRFRLMI